MDVRAAPSGRQIERSGGHGREGRTILGAPSGGRGLLGPLPAASCLQQGTAGGGLQGTAAGVA